LTENTQESNPTKALNKSSRVKLFLIFLLVAAVIIEGYYIYLLQDITEKQKDELISISVQLQLLKNEREELKTSISSAHKATGDTGNGNTAER
jgi:hypothetical protein